MRPKNLEKFFFAFLFTEPIKKARNQNKVLQVIQKWENETEKHLHDTDDDGELHLKRIGKRDLVKRQRPDLFKTKF